MIHPTAIVHPNAKIARGVEIGPYCVVGEHVSIGTGTVLQAHVVVNGWTEIGENCEIYPFATIGAASQDRKYHGERAYTRIGNRTIMREYVSIQRATGEDEVTAVGDDCLLLAYVAHCAQLHPRQRRDDEQSRAARGPRGSRRLHHDRRPGRRASVYAHRPVRDDRRRKQDSRKDVPPFFLIEGNPAQPYGLNSVGLRRAGFTRCGTQRDQEVLQDSLQSEAQCLASDRTR